MNIRILALVALSSICTTAHAADQLLQGCEFAKDNIAPWKLFSLPGTPPTERVVANGVLTVKALGATDRGSDRQLTQDVKLVNGKKYVISFEAKARYVKKDRISVVLAPKYPKVGNMGLWRNIELTEDWQPFKFQFTADPIEPEDTPVLKFLMGKVVADISFRNIKLEPVAEQ